MTPAEVITMKDCASNYGVFKVQDSGGASYTVYMNGSEGPSHCTCGAFQRDDGMECIHVSKVWEYACLYNPQWRVGKPSPELRPVGYTYDRFAPGSVCMCGGPMVLIRRAV